MRTREAAPLKPPDVDIDLHRFTSTHHYESPINRKFSSRLNLIFSLTHSQTLSLSFSLLSMVMFLNHSLFVYSPHSPSGQHQHQPLYINKRMILSTKRQTPAGSI